MCRVTDDLYEQEVAELTELLRTEWDDLRAALAGVAAQGCLLAAHVEDEEDGTEHGVLVNSPDEILRFTVDGPTATIERVTAEDARAEFPTVDAALRLL